MRVFIGGSKSISSLPDSATLKLRKLIDAQAEFIIGDCYGADRAVQRYFAAAGYRNVTVYYTGARARNNVGNYAQINVPSSYEAASMFEYRRSKDIRMELECDSGFMIWDGTSKGTLQNIIDLTAMHKYVLVCRGDTVCECCKTEIGRLLVKNQTTISLWLDDIREAPADFIRTRSVYEAEMLIECAEEFGIEIAKIDCDHDLGQYAPLGGDGIKLIDWLAERKTFYRIALHTMNPVGRENMQREIDRYWKNKV